MASFGELVLVLGDLHIPQRANMIPEKFKRMLVPNKMQHVICTGNIGRDQYDELCGLAPNVHVVEGDFDGVEENDIDMQEQQQQNPNQFQYQQQQQQQQLKFPEHTVVQVGQFRIGVIHGHQILPYKSQDAIARMRRKLNVDILVSGHSHENQVVVHDGYYHINPGSITGAYSSLTENVKPSFILLAIQDNKLVCYVYELVNGEVEVSKTEFTKKMSETASPALLQSLLS